VLSPAGYKCSGNRPIAAVQGQSIRFVTTKEDKTNPCAGKTRMGVQALFCYTVRKETGRIRRQQDAAFC
jgi:hypothetical protein